MRIYLTKLQLCDFLYWDKDASLGLCPLCDSSPEDEYVDSGVCNKCLSQYIWEG